MSDVAAVAGGLLAAPVEDQASSPTLSRACRHLSCWSCWTATWRSTRAFGAALTCLVAASPGSPRTLPARWPLPLDAARPCSGGTGMPWPGHRGGYQPLNAKHHGGERHCALTSHELDVQGAKQHICEQHGGYHLPAAGRSLIAGPLSV